MDRRFSKGRHGHFGFKSTRDGSDPFKPDRGLGGTRPMKPNKGKPKKRRNRYAKQH